MVLTPNVGDVTQTMMDSARVGLEYIVENGDYTEKLALGNLISIQLPITYISRLTLTFA